MIDRLRFRYRMRQLQRERRKYSKILDRAARGAKDDVQRWQLQEVAEFELGRTYDEIYALISERLLDIARTRLLPVPHSGVGDTWMRSDRTGQLYLSTQGISEVRAMIRKDRKERHELMLPWLSLAIGLVGALTGLVAIILGLS